MKYEIDFTDRNGATSAIDTVHENPGFTAEEYIEACRKYADQEWVDMLESGTVTVVNVTEYRINPNCFHLWGSDADENTVLTYEDVVNFSREWEKSVDELLEQLEEI